MKIISSHLQMFFKIGVLEISKYSRETNVLESLFNKLYQKETPKNTLPHRCCPVNIEKLFVTHFLNPVLLDNKCRLRSFC